MHGVRYLVDVLPPGPLGADRSDFDFVGRDDGGGTHWRGAGMGDQAVYAMLACFRTRFDISDSV